MRGRLQLPLRPSVTSSARNHLSLRRVSLAERAGVRPSSSGSNRTQSSDKALTHASIRGRPP